jgi:hypothetical protein
MEGLRAEHPLGLSGTATNTEYFLLIHSMSAYVGGSKGVTLLRMLELVLER